MALDIRDADALVALGRTLAARGYRFTTVTPATHRRVNARAGNARASDLRGIFGWSRAFDRALLDDELLGLMRAAGVLVEREEGLHATVRVSSLGERLYFHSAHPTDDENAVFFGPDTCRFVAAIGRHGFARPPARIVDVGCGAGPAAIELALRFPDAEVIAADVNKAALTLSAVNARLAGAANVGTCRGSLLDNTPGQFDLVVSNPPYIADRDSRAYRDGGALHGDALSVQLVDDALPRLHPGGELLLYTGVAMTGQDDPFRTAIRDALNRQCTCWQYQELDPDVFGEQLDEPGYEDVERIAAVWLAAQARGA
jgi:methylase of polypeptide subunit release factors